MCSAPAPRPVASLFQPLPSPAPSTAITVASATRPGWALPLLCHQRELEKPRASGASSTRAWAGFPLTPASVVSTPDLPWLLPPGPWTPARSSQRAVPDGPPGPHLSPSASPAPTWASHGGQEQGRAGSQAPGTHTMPPFSWRACGLGKGARHLGSVSLLLNGPKEGKVSVLK